MAVAVLPILDPTRWASYNAGSFALANRASGGLDATFAPADPADTALFTVGEGTFFFVPAGATKTPKDGPTVTPSAGKNILLIHVVSAWDWSPLLAPTGQPVADWWALEGVTRASVETYLDALPLDALAAGRQFASGADYKAAVLAGDASVNVLDLAQVGQLDPGGGGPITLGVRCFAGTVEIGALSALSTLPSLDANLANHPLVAAASTAALASDIDIHVRFVRFVPKTTNAGSEVDKGAYAAIPRPAGATISLRKRPAAGLEEDLATAAPDANGQVRLRLRRADLIAKVSLAAGDKLYFRLLLPGAKLTTQYQHDASPREADATLGWRGAQGEWGTEGFVTTDGTVGSLDFLAPVDPATNLTIGPALTAVGTVDHPLEYYAGVPLFMQVQYPVVYLVNAAPGPSYRQEIRSAPKGVVVTMRNAAGVLGTFRTDEHGQVWGTVTQWDPGDTALEARVEYRMEDASIKLIEISGAVDALGAPGEARFFSSTADTENLGSFVFTGGSIGRLISAVGEVGLEQLQVGAVSITNADQDVNTTNGRHAGVLFAFQHVRYIHQWFHYLTLGARANNSDASWSTLLAANSQGNPQGLDLRPPMIRVMPRLPAPDQLRMGELVFEINQTPPENSVRWTLKLYGDENFRIVLPPVPGVHKGENVVEFWRVHTIWHEYSHGVFNTVFNVLSDLPGRYTQFTNAKDFTASGTINEVHDGWSTLDEAFAELPELALLESGSGLAPALAANGPGNLQYWTAEDRAGGGVDYYLDEGLLIATVPNPGGGAVWFPKGALDRRLGLRVPDAFAWGLWTALKKLGTFECLKTLCAGTRGIPTGNDMSNEVPYLTSAADRTLFQRLVWSPILALRTPNVPGPPELWNDIDPNVAGPANGDAARALIQVPGPTTLRWIEIFKDTGYQAMSAADQAVIRNLFGATPDPAGAQATDQIPYFLWFSPW